MSLKSIARQNYVNKSIINSTSAVTTGVAAPVITSLIICDSSYNNLDDTALDPAGSYVKLIGTGFKSGCTVYFNNATVTTTFVSSTEVRVQTPATSVGAYTMMLFNPSNQGGAIYLNLSVSNMPSFTTSAGSIGTYYEANTISNTIAATGDTPLSYSLYSGSLPTGATLNSDGTITGTSPLDSGTTTYSFVVNVKDAQNQDATRSFSLTINTDPVSWTTPSANATVYTSYEYAPIANVTLSAATGAGKSITYSANVLPGGITLTGNTISGTNNLVGNTYTRLTATAANTGRTNTRDVIFNVTPDIVTWSSPADATSYTLSGGSAMSNVTLSATSAAGQSISYVANNLPAGVAVSGSVIYGTPTAAQTVNTLLTATSNVTNRSATRTVSWTIALGDLYWKYTTLLLNATAAANTFINDASLNNYQLTVSGNNTSSLITPYAGSYYSNYFDGAADYLSIPNNSLFSPGTGDFTLEAWIYPTTAAGSLNMIFVHTNGLSFYRNASGKLELAQDNVGALVTSTNNITVSSWSHVVVTRTGTTMKLFINGAQEASVTNSTNIAGNGVVNIGYVAASSLYSFAGYISNLRLVKGTGVYTTAFTPSTTPLTAVANTSLLTCQSNRLIDTSVNNFAITKNGDVTVSPATPFGTPTTAAYNTLYSTYFDGTGDRITVTSNTALEMGTGDFTMECWAYPVSFGNAFILYIHFSGTGARFGFSLIASGVNIDSTSGLALSFTGTTAITVGQWYHVAITRSGSTFRTWINGVQCSTATSSGTYSPTGVIASIGDYPDDFATGYGYISNLRIVKGTALYTSTFTPPTSTLTAISGTSLLTCQSNTIIDNSTNAIALTSLGDTKIVTVSPFTMTTANNTLTSLGSGYFRGSLDYLKLTNSTFWTVPTATTPLTVESWVYPTVTASGTIITEQFTIAGDPVSMTLSLGSTVGSNATSNKVWFGYYTGAGWGGAISTSVLPVNAWSHIAGVYTGSAINIYVNGVLDGTASSSSWQTTASTTGYIGRGWDDTTLTYFTGYISNLRVIKGTALYTNNFLPPQTTLTAVANTQLLTCQYNGGVVNGGIIDNGTFNNIITRVGNVSQGTFSPYSVTGWSNYFNGSSDYLTIVLGSSSSNLNFDTSNFTVEFWVFHSSSGATEQYIDSQTNGFSLQKNSADKIVLSTAGVGTILTTTASVVIGQWNHIAVVRSATSTLNVYLNGTSIATQSVTTNFSGTTTLYIGRQTTATAYLKGYLSNLRIFKNYANYTSTFTPPTSPLTAVANTQLLTCQSNAFVDNSVNAFTITPNSTPKVQSLSPFGSVGEATPLSYSNYFNGTSDYITGPTNTALITTGPFTFEAWVYPNTFSNDKEIFENAHWDTGQTGGFRVYIKTTGKVALGAGTGTYNTYPDVLISNTAISLNTWSHVAITRDSSNLISCYINGVSSVTPVSRTTSLSLTSDGNIGLAKIGASVSDGSAGTSYFNGFISNLRLVQGTAVYTSNFTPSTTPLTAVANTVLLTCQSSTIRDNSANNYTLSSVGSPKTLKLNPFGYTAQTSTSYTPSLHGGSAYFDGTGDYLTTPNNSRFQILSGGNFTIEAWVYINVSTSTQVICSMDNSAGTDGYEFRLDTQKVTFVYAGSASASGTITVPVGAWTHVSISRSGTQHYVSTNGVVEAVSLTNRTADNTADTFKVGTATPAASVPLNGYITDLRVTKGTALYTSSFVPPVQTLTNYSSTVPASLLLNMNNGGVVDSHSSTIMETVGNAQTASEDAYAGSYYSNYFDGTGDYITSTTVAGQVTAGDLTIECWFYPVAEGSLRGWIVSQGTNATGCWGIALNQTTRFLAVWIDSYTAARFTTATAVTLGQWHHLALVKSSGTITLYLDGVLQSGSYAQAGSFGQSASTLVIGAYSAALGNNPFNGYISNLRMVTGSALYSGANFTPTNLPLTVTSGTQLLTCQSNRFIDNSSNAITLTSVGDAAVKSFNPFQQNTGKSIFFDGTGDFLRFMPGPNPNFDLGGGDWTIEMWMYPTSSAAVQLFMDIYEGNASGRLTLQLNTARTIGNYGVSGAVRTATTTTVTLNAWNHVAFCKASGSLRIFINGVQGNTTYADSVTYTCTNNNVHIGSNGSTAAGGNNFFGYLDDLRISKGYARYTSNFTPPTTAYLTR